MESTATKLKGTRRVTTYIGAAVIATVVGFTEHGSFLLRFGDALEEQLFRPVQLAYGRAKRTHTEFARRYDFPERAFAPAVPGAPSHGVKGFVDTAVDAVDEADRTLTEIQDSMMPVEVGDPELRAGLADTRARLGGVRGAARDFVRTLGR